MGVWEEKRALRFLPENPGGVPTCLHTASTLKHAHIFPTFLPSAFNVIPQICGLLPHVLGAVSKLSCPTPYLASETEAGKAPPPHLNTGAEQGEGWVSERCWLQSRALWECAGQQDMEKLWFFTVTSYCHHQFLLPWTFCPGLSISLITYKAQNAE